MYLALPVCLEHGSIGFALFAGDIQLSHGLFQGDALLAHDLKQELFGGFDADGVLQALPVLCHAQLPAGLKCLPDPAIQLRRAGEQGL